MGNVGEEQKKVISPRRFNKENTVLCEQTGHFFIALYCLIYSTNYTIPLLEIHFWGTKQNPQWGNILSMCPLWETPYQLPVWLRREATGDRISKWGWRGSTRKAYNGSSVCVYGLGGDWLELEVGHTYSGQDTHATETMINKMPNFAHIAIFPRAIMERKQMIKRELWLLST